MERYRNKRRVFRRRGRFCKPPTLQDMGFDVAPGEMICADCGHRWHPVLISGSCPECGSQRKKSHE